MTLLKCKFCGNEIIIDNVKVEKEKYIQCPKCGEISENPLYED